MSTSSRGNFNRGRGKANPVTTPVQRGGRGPTRTARNVSPTPSTESMASNMTTTTTTCGNAGLGISEVERELIQAKERERARMAIYDMIELEGDKILALTNIQLSAWGGSVAYLDEKYSKPEEWAKLGLKLPGQMSRGEGDASSKKS